MRRKSKLPVTLDERPEWKQKVDRVHKLVAQGFTEDQITSLTLYPKMEVDRIISEERYAKEIAEKNYQTKIPVMREIIGGGLEVLNAAIKEMHDPEVRRKMIPGVGQMAALKNIIQDLEMLIRLNEGKTTANVGVVQRRYSETRTVIQDLRKIDPVFEYPELPNIPEEKVDEVS